MQAAEAKALRQRPVGLRRRNLVMMDQYTFNLPVLANMRAGALVMGIAPRLGGV